MEPSRGCELETDAEVVGPSPGGLGPLGAWDMCPSAGSPQDLPWWALLVWRMWTLLQDGWVEGAVPWAPRHCGEQDCARGQGVGRAPSCPAPRAGRGHLPPEARACCAR